MISLTEKFGHAVIDLMAVVAGAEIAEGVASALLSGGFAFGSASAADWIPAVRAGLAETAGLGGLLYGAMAPTTGRRRRRQNGSGSSGRRVRQRTTPSRMPAAPGELKRVRTNTAVAGYPVTNAWAIVPTSGGTTIPLNGISVGTGKDNRIGNRATMKMLNIQGYVLFPENATTVADQFVRIAIVFDKQANEVAPTPVDVYADRTGQTQLRVCDFRDEDYIKRYQVIADVWVVNHTNSYRPHKIPFRIDKVLNKDVVWTGIGNTYADISTGSFTMIACASPGGAASIFYQSLLKFTG